MPQGDTAAPETRASGVSTGVRNPGDTNAEPCGVAVIDKPGSITSHDVVARVRRLLGTSRVGHAGTLDPMATGVLVVCVGAATRIIEYLPAEPKVYDAAVTFGLETDTEDITGTIVGRKDASRLDARSVAGALTAFEGPIMQTPPMVSAVRVGGRRLYELARRGATVERQPRPVTVHRLELLDFVSGVNPVARIRVECSAGTYVRTLASEIGRRLACGGVLSELRRTRVGEFSIADAQPIEEAPKLMSVETAMRNRPLVELDSQGWTDIAHGRSIDHSTLPISFGAGQSAEPALSMEGQIALASRSGEGYAIVRIAGGRLHPVKVMRLSGSRA